MSELRVNKKKLFSILAVLIIALIVSLRGNTPDTSVYANIFNNIDSYSLNSTKRFYSETGVEWGLGALAYIASSVYDNASFFFFIVSFLTTYAIYKTSQLIGVKFTYVLLAYIPTFFMVQQLMQMRQGLSTALIFLAFVGFNYERAKSLVIIAIASMLHSSAFVILPLLLFISKPFKLIFEYFQKETVKASLIFIAVTVILAGVLLGIITNFSPRAVAYINSGNRFSQPRGLLDPANIREYLMLTFFIMHRKYFIKNRLYFILLLAYVFDIAIRIAFRDYTILSARLGAVFAFSEIYLLPMVLTKYTRLSAIFIATLYFILNMFIALYIRVPTMVTDYFTPRLY